MEALRILLMVGVIAVGCSGPGTPAATATASTTTTASGATTATTPAAAIDSSTAPPVTAAALAPTAMSPRALLPTATTSSASPTTPPAVPATGGATIAGCPLFPADNAWRQDISRSPVDPHSAAWVASAGSSTNLHPDFGSNPTYGIPYIVVPAGQPKVPITFTAYGDQSNPGPYPVPSNAPVESGSDRHVLVASADCHLYEMYNASRNALGGWNADAGAVFNLRSDTLRPDTWTSADAAGLPILAGLVRMDEIQAGHIDHALRFTISKTQKGFIHPATHQAGSTTNANVPPMGARFRLKASFDTSRFHGAALIILTCLKRYGMFVADNGSNWYISGATDTRWNDTDLNQLKSVPGSSFEVVSTGAIVH
jgi:hypothetical protein